MYTRECTCEREDDVMEISIHAASRSTTAYAMFLTELGALVTRVSFSSIATMTSGVAS